MRAAAVGAGRSLTSAAELSVRVDVKLLDSLMNVVGELVLTRNQILQQAEAVGDNGLLASAQRLNVLTADLQDSVMQTRMQPIGTLLSGLPRLVRDLAMACHKQVQLDVEGHETELDRTLIEAVKDPLTHLVRNALDHGIEPPSLRVANGKPEQGRLTVRAFHQGGHVNIEITDDGAGIDLDQVRRLAVERGLIEAHAGAGDVGSRDGVTHLRCRESRPRPRSPWCPGGASVWTWSRPTSSESAARSTSRPNEASGRPS